VNLASTDVRVSFACHGRLVDQDLSMQSAILSGRERCSLNPHLRNLRGDMRYVGGICQHWRVIPKISHYLEIQILEILSSTSQSREPSLQFLDL
jgi:hypothetical protein